MNKEMSEIYKFSHYLHDNDDGDVDVRGTWIRSVKSANLLRILLLSEIEFLQSCQIFLCTSVTEFDSNRHFLHNEAIEKKCCLVSSSLFGQNEKKYGFPIIPSSWGCKVSQFHERMFMKTPISQEKAFSDTAGHVKTFYLPKCIHGSLSRFDQKIRFINTQKLCGIINSFTPLLTHHYTNINRQN